METLEAVEQEECLDMETLPSGSVNVSELTKQSARI